MSVLPALLEGYARIAMRFSVIRRATFDPDGVPETNGAHVVMLLLCAAEFAEEHPELLLRRDLLLEYAVVHDLPETFCGDRSTLGWALLSAEERLRRVTEKAAAEAAGLEEVLRAAGPWLERRLLEYHAQEVPEARVIRYLDKVLPRLTHTLNGGAAVRAGGLSPADLHATNARQLEQLAGDFPELAGTPVEDLLREAGRRAVDAYTAASIEEELTGPPPLRGEDLRRAVRDRHGETASAFWMDGRWYVGWMAFYSGTGSLNPVLLTYWNDGETEESALRAALTSPVKEGRSIETPPSGFTWSSRG